MTEARLLYGVGSYFLVHLGGSLLHSGGSCWPGFPYKCYKGISGVSSPDGVNLENSKFTPSGCKDIGIRTCNSKI